MTPDAARNALVGWASGLEASAWDADSHLASLLRFHGRPHEANQAFGAVVSGTLDRLIRENNRDENLPQLRRWDAVGRRTEEVVFHPSYLEIGRRVFRTGVIGRYATPGEDRVQLAFAYLVAHHGEGGHLCPLACTSGLVKLLQARGDEALKDRLLPGLLSVARTDPAHFHAAQFLTEIQGGSDVGANAVTARLDGDTWRVSGEKWFCSVIDADLYLMTARPEGAPAGTAGLGAFVVPRLLPDGSLNGVFVRRLKYKLGTRSMASGEADFQDALAWPIGPVEGGFKAVVELVLNTSRLYNAVGACGILRRAEIEATTYARHRTAFGQSIDQFPLVKRSLEFLRNERRLAVAGTYELVAIADRMALRGFGSALLFEPEITLEMAAWYVRALLEKFNGQSPLAIAAYNAGPHRVAAWLKRKGGLPMDEFIEEIPYDEAREYTKKVIRFWGLYRRIYQGRAGLDLQQRVDPNFKDNINF